MGVLKFDRDNHKYYDGDRELVSVTRLLAATGLAKDLAFLELDPIYLERGTAVHEIFGLIDRDEYDEDGTSKELRPYAAGIKAFKCDTGFDGRIWELSLAMPEVGIAGTIDCLGICASQIWLPDIKTGVLQELGVGCQLALYEDLIWHGEVIQTSGFDSDWFQWMRARTKAIYRKSLNLKGDGTYTLRSHDGPEWRKRARAAVTMYNTWREFGLLKESRI